MGPAFLSTLALTPSSFAKERCLAGPRSHQCSHLAQIAGTTLFSKQGLPGTAFRNPPKWTNTVDWFLQWPAWSEGWNVKNYISSNSIAIRFLGDNSGSVEQKHLGLESEMGSESFSCLYGSQQSQHGFGTQMWRQFLSLGWKPPVVRL